METTSRPAVTNAARIVVKIGSSSLTRPDGRLDLNRLDDIATAVGRARQAGQAPVIISSGAMAAGRGRLALPTRPKDLATAQAVASVGQSVLMAHWRDAFVSHGIQVAQVLLTAHDLHVRSHYTNATQALEKLLSLGVVPIVNENDAVATEEIRFGDNDRLSMLVAQLLHADVLILLTDVDGLYDRPPSRPGARRIEVVRGPADLAGLDVTGRGSDLGTGGMVSKTAAASAAAAAGIAVVLTSADQLAAALAGHSVGTWFEPTGRHGGNRRAWVAHAAPSAGTVWLDAGATRAVVGDHRSLLAPGITQVDGRFAAGDVVALAAPDGTIVGRGISAYGADDVRALLAVGPGEAARPVIHRDDLALY